MIYLPVIVTTLYSLNNGVIKKSFVQHIPIVTKCQKITQLSLFSNHKIQPNLKPTDCRQCSVTQTKCNRGGSQFETQLSAKSQRGQCHAYSEVLKRQSSFYKRSLCCVQLGIKTKQKQEVLNNPQQDGAPLTSLTLHSNEGNRDKCSHS